jgi:hypothetical protein
VTPARPAEVTGSGTKATSASGSTTSASDDADLGTRCLLTSELEELEPQPPRSAPPTAPDHRLVAESILRPWWEQQSPKPGQPYIAARKVLEGLLAKGWTVDELTEGLREVLVVSGGAFDVWRRRDAKRTTASRDNGAVAADVADRVGRMLGVGG